MWRRVIDQKVPDVSKNCCLSLFRAKQSYILERKNSYTAWFWRRMHQHQFKHQELLPEQQNATCQKTCLYQTLLKAQKKRRFSSPLDAQRNHSATAVWPVQLMRGSNESEREGEGGQIPTKVGPPAAETQQQSQKRKTPCLTWEAVVNSEIFPILWASQAHHIQKLPVKSQYPNLLALQSTVVTICTTCFNIKLTLYFASTHLSQDMDKCRAFVNAVMNLRFA